MNLLRRLFSLPVSSRKTLLSPVSPAKPLANRAGAQPLGVLPPASTTATAHASLTSAQAVSAANRWREQYNPLRGFTIGRAVLLLEQITRGDMAEAMWLFWHMCRQYPTLVALIERRTSALGELDCTWKTVPMDRLPPGCTPADARAQRDFLRAQYERIDNLGEAIEELALASFHGFTFLQIQALLEGEPDGARAAGIDAVLAHPDAPIRFEPLRRWNLLRDGLDGRWFWNPDARSGTALSLPPENALELRHFLTRTVPRPINVVALPLFCREALGERDWAGFVEVFGLPGGVVIAPPNIPDDQQAGFQAAAGDIAEGGSGSLPHGSEWKPTPLPHRGAPFAEFLKNQREQLVLAGTGGKLTMLAESGSGTLAGGAHAETFRSVVRAEARHGIKGPR
ncbi:MAG TPA: hypothetical protein VMB21_16495, partial [Candidatus Limnocylindria bacterium]|nr:hypothetical protein [Candidatus Limnocylindria bacterium]